MANPSYNPNQDARDGNGRYARTLNTAQRDAQAARLAAQGLTYQQIADEIGISNKGDAWRAVQRARQAAIQPAGEELIATEAAELDTLYAEVMEILARDHVMVSHGRIVCGDDGEPILDDGPKLAAIDRAVKIRESYRKLRGVDAPSRVSVDAERLGTEIAELLSSLGGSSDDGTGD